MLAIAHDEERAGLEAAIAKARETAEGARQRWVQASAAERGNWAVKWAAPTLAGGVEHVWVRPTHWSEFRIEGVLDSPPQSELACGRTLGDTVGFPNSELSDWVFAPSGDFAKAAGREGGFTIDALEQ